MLVVRSDVHRCHHGDEFANGELTLSWESPERADIVSAAIDAAARHRIIAPTALDRALVEAVHATDYVDFLETAWQTWNAEHPDARSAMGFTWPARHLGQKRPTSIDGLLGFYSFAADCAIVEGTWLAACESAAIAQTAAQSVADGEPFAFGLCRPPGHHAMRDLFGGYCYLNNAAIAAECLRRSSNARIAVLDIDYHHGNGTQDIFYRRSDVLFASLHADPLQEFPYFLGHADETGEGDGDGWNRNYPMPWGTGIDQWLASLDDALAWIAESGCESLVISVGVDTFVDDPISRFLLQTSDFPVIGDRLRQAGLPTVLLLEGGYATEALGANVKGLLDGFEGVQV